MTVHDALAGFHERDWQTTRDGTLRLALVGLGWWTVEKAIPAIAASDHCETTVLVSSSTAKAERVAADVAADDDVAVPATPRGISYDEFHDGEATDDYDAVYVCTPNALHLEYVESAAEHGKHVLCEKPMEASVERAERMVAACDEHDVRLAVGYRMQTEPAIRRARELVREGAIGDPRLVHGANTQRLLDIFDSPDQWRLDPDLTGYGTSVMDLGVYPINTARFLLDADPVAVQASMRSNHDAFDDVPDEHAAFLVEFDDGTMASCTASQNAHENTFLEVTGTDGTLRLDPAFHMETDLSLSVDGSTVSVDQAQRDQMRELFDYFAHAILADASVSLDGEHGVVDLRTIAAIHRSADDGERKLLD
ncbi:D-xylose 1-dehydrogenase Gfo6 [Halorubellus salinus]|uniref:D-xylose 1-dehydrogenase Gfo6 n=1 Tax=Halorubellus salinus TaxID=755309 RepID=UPI001D081CE6|nr:D-xylose 1-dehydrogenase Gfo6 [Halorubellus salinus]